MKTQNSTYRAEACQRARRASGKRLLASIILDFSHGYPLGRARRGCDTIRPRLWADLFSEAPLMPERRSPEIESTNGDEFSVSTLLCVRARRTPDVRRDASAHGSGRAGRDAGRRPAEKRGREEEGAAEARARREV